uniref:Phosphoglucomutase n=1 Tax=Rostrostelium ellipticum TaxID=361140 RepID=A0A1L2FV45_9MYCE|nr:phosphoglucomutase [Rostrostelium ellipticum]
MADLDKLVEDWMRWDKNTKTRDEVQKMVAQGDKKALAAALQNRIAFGTAGLRGPMKAGFANMNDLTVIQASQGLCIYVSATIADAAKKGVVVGYDGRHNSLQFARLTAATFRSKGFKVYLFSTVVPTPYVAFSVPELGACVGVMVTASHNPKDDNGYKIDVEKLLKEDGVEDPLEKITASYMSKVADYSIKSHPATKDIVMSDDKIVYTAMHGVGGEYTRRSFKAFSLPEFIPVVQQFHPDPEFPTVTFPNPEEGKGALKLAIETAEKNNSRLILANDPDADRLAVAERQPDGTWKVFNGNEIGVLFADWAWKNARARDPTTPASEFFMVNTAVSSAMLKTMAKTEGYTYEETLTGFKWVGNKAKEAIDKGGRFLFAYEEAIGFMYGDVSLDKDGVRTAPIFAQMALSLYAKGLSCVDHLEQLMKTYGYHISRNRYFFCYEPPKMVAIFDKIRNNGNFPKHCGPFEIVRVRDLTVDYDDAYEDKKARLPVSTSTQMITFYFKNGAIATLRGSGTEPKLKYYVEMIGDKSAKKEDVEKTLAEVVKQVIDNFLRPVENELTPPKDD